MPSRDPHTALSAHPEDVEDELAAALPQAHGTPFFPAFRRWALHIIPFVLLAAAGYILWRDFRDISFGDVTAAMRGWRRGEVLGALALSASSFVIMGIVEWFGFRWAGVKGMGFGRTLFGSFMAAGIAHTMGATLLVAGAVRARYYSRFGVTLRQVAAVTLFNGFAFAIGLSTLAGLGLVLSGADDIAATRIAGPVADIGGSTLIAGVAGYLVLCATMKRPLSGFGHSVKLPSLRLALMQLAMGLLDNAVAAAILWILLPSGTIPYLTFVGAYAPSVVAGLISHVPGGVGVFEGSLSTLLAGVPAAPLAAGFLGYRLAFFVLPLLTACSALVIDALVQRARRS